MRTLDASLITSQQVGYPTGGYNPAIQCILYSNNSAVSYDYSSDPTLTTNKLIHAQQEEKFYRMDDSFVITDTGLLIFQNSDRTFPENLTGYHVDIGWGMNTSDGLKYGVSNRMWVTGHNEVDGGTKNEMPHLYSVLELEGIWSAVLKRQPVKIGDAPFYLLDESTVATHPLAGLTIYGCIEYLLETGLVAQTGLPTTLQPLVEDDGYIDSIIPFPSTGVCLRTINSNAPYSFNTYSEVILSLLELTNSYIIPKASLGFEIKYPQTSDAVDQTYYVSQSEGHPFYEVADKRVGFMPNHIEVYGADLDKDGVPDYEGHWFDSDHFSTPPVTFTPAAIEAAYDGNSMPITRTIVEDGLVSDSDCDDRAGFFGKQIKESVKGSRYVVPMDAAIELYDNVESQDNSRGH